MPRFSDSTRPASLSFAMWCEMVSWVSSRPAVKSQMQMGASAFHSDAIMVSRVGSASAFIRLEVWFAHLVLTLGSSQHAPRSRSTGSSLIAMDSIVRNPSTDVDGGDRLQPTEVHRSKEPTDE